MVEISLVPEDIERLQNDETVRVTIPGLEQPGRNSTIEITPSAGPSEDYGSGAFTDAVRLVYEDSTSNITGYDYNE